ncbi:MAG: CBASS oligonucleotide cyclase [bacterium]
MEITDTDINVFLEERVNLKKEKVSEYRAQVSRLIENFGDYLKQHEDFGLRKLIHFGSCAKGTAISTTSDLDVAVYLTPDKDGEPLDNMLSYIRNLLSESMQQYGMSDDQFTIGNHCVCVYYKGTKIKVDVVPIIPINKNSHNEWGWLMHKHSSERLKTSIPLHLKFIQKRKETFKKYAAFVRLTKWWKSIWDAPIKSFIIELIWAHLIDTAEIPDSFCDGFPYFFKYILKTQLKDRVIFSDNYSPSDVTRNSTDLVQIYDPVNSENNVAKTVNSNDYTNIIKHSQSTMNIVMMATCAPSKTKAIEQWQRILGTSFNPYNL